MLFNVATDRQQNNEDIKNVLSSSHVVSTLHRSPLSLRNFTEKGQKASDRECIWRCHCFKKPRISDDRAKQHSNRSEASALLASVARKAASSKALTSANDNLVTFILSSYRHRSAGTNSIALSINGISRTTIPFPLRASRDQKSSRESSRDSISDNSRMLTMPWVNPRCKKLKRTEQSVLEWLPAEIFCQILSFVGPTSNSLVALSEVNTYMNKTMNAIGKAMLPRAQSNFRVPLVPLSPNESCTSLFLRHSRACSNVLQELANLRKRLNQNLPDVAAVDQAMDTALRLLEVGPTLSVSLERQILSTAGKAGGKVFKWTKHRALQNLEHGLHAEMSTIAPHQQRLDMARLIMQIVVFRDLQIATQPTLLVHANPQVLKKTISMNAF